MVWILTLAVAAGVARRLSLFLLVIGCVCAVSLVRRRAAWLAFVVVAAGVAALGLRANTDYARDCEAVVRMAAVAGAANVTLDGIVSGFPQSGPQGTTFDFTTRIEGRRVSLMVRAECFDAAYGDRYRLHARFTHPTASTRSFIASRGASGVVRVRARDVTRLGCGGNPALRAVFWPLHRFARTRLSRAMGSDAGLAIGMLLGERTQLEAPVRDAVRRLGITHLLAISGMHLTTLAGCVLLATRMWPRGRSMALFAVLTIYTLSVGNIESLTRAYVMATILIATHALIRPARALDALAKALLAMAVASPLCLRSVGLQLSFAATFAVLLMLPHPWQASAADGNRLKRWSVAAAKSLAAAFVMSVAVEVFIAPLQLHHFHVLSVAGPLATVVFFFPLTVVLLAAVPVVALACVFPGAEWPGQVLGTLSLATTHAIRVCGRIMPGPFHVPEPDPWIYYGVLAACWRWRYWLRDAAKRAFLVWVPRRRR